MPEVSLSHRANISRLETTHGLIRRRTPLVVPVEWALMRIQDENLMFVFKESDRKELLETDEKTLKILSRVMGEELSSASKLCSLLLPKKKATPKPKTTTKSKKKSSLASK